MLTTETRRHGEFKGIQAPDTELVIGAAIEVQRTLGPGLLESAYEECLCREIFIRGGKLQRQIEVPVAYKGVRLDCGYRIDLLVNDSVIGGDQIRRAVAARSRGTAYDLASLARKEGGPIDQLQRARSEEESLEEFFSSPCVRVSVVK